MITATTPTASKRCLLVRPAAPGQTFYSMAEVCRVVGAKAAAPPLGLLAFAALLPPEWELRLADGLVAPVTDDQLRWADLVAISGLAPHQHATLEVVARAHALGKKAIVGGPGPTLYPEAYAAADYLCTGDAEVIAPQLLEDLRAGVPRGAYHATRRSDLSRHPVPRYDLARLSDYAFVGMQFTRGCPFTCEFCCQIGTEGSRPSAKAPEQVLAELQRLYDLGYRGIIDLGYDNFIGSRPRTLELLRALGDWQRRHRYPFCFGTEATVNLARQEDTLSLMAEADFRFVFFGVESPDRAVLEKTSKNQNVGVSAVEAARAFNAHGMIVYGSLILGFDGETAATVGNMIDLVQESGIFPTLIMPLHAFPNTQLRVRLAREGRLFDEERLRLAPHRMFDLAVTGLNFATDRPRRQILLDLCRLLRTVYDPRRHAERVLKLSAQLRPTAKHRPPTRQLAERLSRFGRFALAQTLRPGGATLWRSLATVALENPLALEAVASLAVIQASYAEQSRLYIAALEREIARLDQVGEENHVASMLPRPPPFRERTQAGGTLPGAAERRS